MNIWAEEEAIKFFAKKFGMEKEDEAAALYNRIQEAEKFHFPRSFINCESTIFDNLVSFCRTELR